MVAETVMALFAMVNAAAEMFLCKTFGFFLFFFLFLVFLGICHVCGHSRQGFHEVSGPRQIYRKLVRLLLFNVECLMDNYVVFDIKTSRAGKIDYPRCLEGGL